MGLFDLFSKGKKSDNEKFFKCKDCEMKFTDKERLKRHSKKAHNEKGDFMPSTNPFGGPN